MSENYSQDPSSAGVLLDAVIRHSLYDFRYALEVVNCNPNLADASSSLSAFESVLQTPKSVEFIKLCINHGANFYQVRKLTISMKNDIKISIEVVIQQATSGVAFAYTHRYDF